MLACVLAPIVVMGNVNEAVLLHRIKDSIQILTSAGYVLQKNPVFDGFTLKERVTDGISTKKPVLDTSSLHVINILNVITIWSSLLAFDHETKRIKDIPLPFVECPLQHFLTTT